MERWRALSELVGELHAARDPSRETGDVLQDAAALAYRVHETRLLAAPLLVNLAALARSMPRITVHRVSSGAAHLVDDTDLHSLPSEAPALLRGAWIAEARNPEREALFGQTACLGGYPLHDSIFLVGLDWPDGGYVARWRPRWEGSELEEGVLRDASPMIEDVDLHHAWSREAARFAVVFALLLEAEGSWLGVEDEASVRFHDQRRRAPSKAVGGPGWIVRRVYLDEPRRARRAPRPAGEAGMLLEGKSPVTSMVRGHLKRQFYGPGRALRKWVYVRSYEARRWIAPRPLRVEVRTRRETE